MSVSLTADGEEIEDWQKDIIEPEEVVKMRSEFPSSLKYYYLQDCDIFRADNGKESTMLIESIHRGMFSDKL